MESVKYILGQPEFIDDVGYIYPVKVKDYDKFMSCVNALLISKDNFIIEDKNKYLLLDLIIFSLRDENIIKNMEKLFSLVLQKEVSFIFMENKYGFVIEENKIIDRNNYEQVKKIIMKQNLLFEPKIFKDKLVQQWAEKVLEARRRNSIKCDIEDMISTVSVVTGKSYEQIAEQTLYQLYADFKRIMKLKDYDTSISFKCAGAEKVSINHFAETINMFENPYDSLFVKKDKLKNIDKVIGG